ncbi:hypothetical protein NE865_11750 [Phthorimaea operculella]|nr:hypothetical protein NE865_11750 [Phthorimaea operculella]
MPVRKQEAHRALELLEDYHSKLVKPQDRQLRLAIERVIRIFKSRLFQALLDWDTVKALGTLKDGSNIRQPEQQDCLGCPGGQRGASDTIRAGCTTECSGGLE